MNNQSSTYVKFEYVCNTTILVPVIINIVYIK